MSGNARNCSTWSSGRQTPRSSYCAQLPVAEATISPSPVRSHAQPRAAKYCSRTSMGAPSSRSSWISSSLRFTPPGSPSACRRRAWRRSCRCWPCDLGFEGSDPGLQDLILIPSGSGHGLHRLELVAADEVLAAHPFADLLARAGLGFTAHAGHGPGKAVHHFHEVVEHLVLGLHRNSSSFRAEIGICGSIRHPASRDYPQLPEISPVFRSSSSE